MAGFNLASDVGRSVGVAESRLAVSSHCVGGAKFGGCEAMTPPLLIAQPQPRLLTTKNLMLEISLWRLRLVRHDGHSCKLIAMRTSAWPRLQGLSGYLPLSPVARACVVTRWSSSSSSARPSTTASPMDVSAVLSKPTWSVRSLLPAESTSTDTPEAITRSQLHHLLRLSALPLPSTPEEEADMISDLQSQLHFVRDIQRVDVSGVEPLRAIRDETEAGIMEATVGLKDVQDVLDEEVPFGRARRPRRVINKKAAEMAAGVEDWDALATASETRGRYFVVRSGKSGKE